MYFTFEKQAAQPALEEPQSIDYLKLLAGKIILLVEDNQMNRLVVTNLLKRYQIHITDASHGGEAIEKINERAFDLILMDLQMPVMDGLEATRIIRKNNITIPIVALTANAFKSEIDACYESGMNDFATKPIEKDLLLSTIARNLLR